MHFPAYSGGKFIGNCLSLSKHCIVNDESSINHLVKNPTDYNYRLSTMIQKLPNSVMDMKNWVSTYEFGELLHSDYSTNDTVNKIIDNNLMFCVNAHSLNNAEIILKSWGDAHVISLINYYKFQDIAYELKGTRGIENSNEYVEKYNSLRGNSWPSWKEFQSVGYNVTKLEHCYPTHILDEIVCYYPPVSSVVFDMDSCIFDLKLFIISMQKLYNELGFDDFNEKIITTYYNRYIELHI
jgi:hypothetical protein